VKMGKGKGENESRKRRQERKISLLFTFHRFLYLYLCGGFTSVYIYPYLSVCGFLWAEKDLQKERMASPFCRIACTSKMPTKNSLLRLSSFPLSLFLSLSLCLCLSLSLSVSVSVPMDSLQSASQSILRYRHPLRLFLPPSLSTTQPYSGRPSLLRAQRI
jgi:hypothetical protein